MADAAADRGRRFAPVFERVGLRQRLLVAFGRIRLRSCALYNSRMRDRSLPGDSLIQTGLADLRAGVESVPSLLVAIGAPRLARLGIEVPNHPARPEHRLYLLLAATDPDGAHSRYNALVRRLVSFERALACAA